MNAEPRDSGSQKYRCLLLLLGALLILAPAYFATAGDEKSSEAKEVRPLVAVMGQPFGEDFGPQFVDVDRKGHAFLLRGKTLEVFRLNSDGTAENVAQLEGPNGMSQRAPVMGAVMAGDAESWFLHRGQEVWSANSRTAKPLPQVGWRVEELGRIRDEPVVSVLPIGVGRPVRERRILPGAPAPLLLSQAGSAWNVFATEGEVPGLDTVRDDGRYMRFTQERMSELGVGGQNTLWVADQYRYHVREVSAAGKVRWRLTGGMDIQEREDPEDEANQALRERAGPVAAGRMVTANRALQIIFGLTEGADGRLYVLVRGEGGDLAIDRFDPVEMKLERTPLQLDYRGTFSVVAAGDGLYLAGYQGHQGRWFLSWQTLDAADWQVVEGVDFGG